MIIAGDDIESIESRTEVAREVNSSCETCGAGCGVNLASSMDAAAVGKKMVWRAEMRRTVRARRKRWEDRIDRGALYGWMR